MAIEHRRRKAYIQQMMLWDGTPDTAAAIKEWVGDAPAGGSAFPTADEVPLLAGEGAYPHARLYVAHSKAYLDVPFGYRVVQELDGSGFYPLSPEGLRAGFESDPVQCICPNGSLHPQHNWSNPACGVHHPPRPPRVTPA